MPLSEKVISVSKRGGRGKKLKVRGGVIGRQGGISSGPSIIIVLARRARRKKRFDAWKAAPPVLAGKDCAWEKIF